MHKGKSQIIILKIDTIVTTSQVLLVLLIAPIDGFDFEKDQLKKKLLHSIGLIIDFQCVWKI